MIRHGADGTVYILAPNVELEAALDKVYQRIPGLLQWRVPNQGAAQVVAEFFNTVTSGMVDDETLEKRKAACNSCPAMVEDRGNKYCSGCKCGRWPLARLDGTWFPKLKWTSLRCPLKRF